MRHPKSEMSIKRYLDRRYWVQLLVTAIYLLLNYVFVFKTPVPLISGQTDIAALSAGYSGWKLA